MSLLTKILPPMSIEKRKGKLKKKKKKNMFFFFFCLKPQKTKLIATESDTKVADFGCWQEN